MCTYNITISDSIIEQVRPVIGADTDINQWMQRQMEALLTRLVHTPRRNAWQYAPDLEAILAMPMIDKSDMGVNGEYARMDYHKEKYGL